MKKNTKKSTKNTKKTAYIPIMKRSLKNATAFNSMISVHASHNPNLSSIRGKENAQLRNTLDTVKTGIIKIDISSKDFAELMPKDTQALYDTFEKKSLYDRLRTKVLKILVKKGYNKKAVFSFAYKNRDTKQGDIITLSSRIRTALKALYYNNEREAMKQIELHKVSRIIPKKELNLVKYMNE